MTAGPAPDASDRIAPDWPYDVEVSSNQMGSSKP